MNIQEAQKLLQQILEKAGFTVDSIDIQEKEDHEFYINILSQADASRIIGRNGDVLRALQSLMKNVFRNQGVIEDQDMVKVDVDSYRISQEQNVIKMADSRAQQVIESGNKSILPPMSPFFRRLVHLHIKENYPDLNTFSRGGVK